MPEDEDFHTDFLPRFIDSLRVFHSGDPDPHIDLWSKREPVTLFAIRGMRNAGSDVLIETFRRVASWFTGVTSDYRWDIVAAEVIGDAAYTVSIESYDAIVDGHQEHFEVRSTHIFRREHGQWRAIHRHADRQPDAAPAAERPQR
jgi:ketosteroid isomerase-like protein